MSKQKIETFAIVMRKYFNMRDILRTYAFLKPFLQKYRTAYLVLLLLLVVDLCLTIAFAWFFGAIIEAAVHGDFDRLKSLVLLGIFLVLSGMASGYFHIYFETVATNGVKKDLKNHLFNHMLRLPVNTASNQRSGELISHFNNDIHSIDGMIGSNLLDLIRLPMIYVTIFIYLFHLNASLSLLSLVIAPVAALGGVIFGLLLRRNSRLIFDLMANINSLLNETFQGFLVIRSFTMETLLFKKYVRQNRELYHLELENAKLQGGFYTGGKLVGSATFFVSLTLGAYFVSEGMMTIGVLLTFVNLVNHLVYPLTGLASQWAGFQRSVVASERILKVLEQPADSADLPSFVHTQTHLRPIEFRNVTFRYDENKRLFDHFNLQIPAGKVVALVGPSGAGKTTLFNLLQSLYKPQSGEIFVGRVSTKNLTLSELRSAIAHVPQETFLFGGTIRENLMVARPNITWDEMIQAAVSANIHDFIVSLPNGYDTEIGERGIKLSGGQKQRVVIARAILKDAPILLMDEATSALDNETEYHVKKALEQLMKGRTTLVIAHRLSTIQNADEIIVLDDGNIVQTGTHEALIRQDGLYRKLHETSFRQDETGSLSLVSR